MTTEIDLAPAPEESDARRKLALLKAVGLDRVPPEQRDLALAIARKYDLDLLLKHLVLIEGRPYVTRDALLWIAHRSGALDGIEVTEPTVRTFEGLGEFWYAEATVYRRDMSHPFKYGGRYPVKGGNAKFAPEMAIKVAAVMALRRAFNVSAPTAEERWDAEIPDLAAEPPKSLAERVAEKAAATVPAVAVLVEPMPESTSAEIESDPAELEAAALEAAAKADDAAPGLTVAELGDRARTAGVGKLKFAVALDTVPAEVAKKIEAMTDQERYALAVTLGLGATS